MRNEGYVHPTGRHEVRFPDPSTRFVCEPCARGALGLGEKELYGHQCGKLCFDIRHAETRVALRHLLDNVTATERIKHFQPAFSEYGWRVDDVVPTVTSLRSNGDWWDVWIVPERILPWPPTMQ